MATSNSQNFTQNRDQIIQDAFEDSGVYGANETIEDVDTQKANRLLNKMIKAWQTKNIGLWNIKEAALFLQNNQNSYDIGSGSTDHCANVYVTTTNSVGANSGDNTITLTTVDGMSVNDNIGVELDNATRQWTTITAINTGTNVVTLNTTLTDSVAANNTVITYTTSINRPLAIPNARRFNLTTNTDVPIILKRHAEYFNIPNKTNTGDVTSYYYDKQLSLGINYVWPVPNSVKDIIKFTYFDVIEDFDSATDNADFPNEWLEAITAGLAYRIAMSGYGVPKDKREQLKAWADETFFAANSFDNEEGVVSVVPHLES